jgi:hypothetical protein
MKEKSEGLGGERGGVVRVVRESIYYILYILIYINIYICILLYIYTLERELEKKGGWKSKREEERECGGGC